MHTCLQAPLAYPKPRTCYFSKVSKNAINIRSSQIITYRYVYIVINIKTSTQKHYDYEILNHSQKWPVLPILTASLFQYVQKTKRVSGIWYMRFQAKVTCLFLSNLSHFFLSNQAKVTCLGVILH